MFTKDAKYIIFDTGLNYVPVIFPNHVQHGSMALMLGQWNPERAGFVRIDDNGSVVAHGESISLMLKSNPELDSKMLSKLFNK
jgi:hypothetical protein